MCFQVLLCETRLEAAASGATVSFARYIASQGCNAITASVTSRLKAVAMPLQRPSAATMRYSAEPVRRDLSRPRMRLLRSATCKAQSLRWSASSRAWTATCAAALATAPSWMLAGWVHLTPASDNVGHKSSPGASLHIVGCMLLARAVSSCHAQKRAERIRPIWGDEHDRRLCL